MRISVFLISLILLMSTALLADEQAKEEKKSEVAPDAVVARVGDVVLTAAQYEKMLEDYPPSSRATVAFGDRNSIIDSWIENEVLYQKALKEGYDKDPETLRLLEQAKRRIIVDVFLRRLYSNIVVTDSEVEDYYNQHIDKFIVPEQVRFKIILVDNEELAGILKRALDGGVDFAELAKQHSIDTTRQRGGETGFIDRQTCNKLYGPEVEKLAFTLEEGQISDPIKTAKGYAIIKVEKKRPAITRTLRDVRPFIESALAREKRRLIYSNLVLQLKKTLDVEVHPEVWKKIHEEKGIKTPALPTPATTSK